MVRANQTVRYTVGVFALPQGEPLTLRRWLIADNLVAVLTPATPVPATPQVRLVAVCSAPGSLVLDTVRVTFRELPEGTA